MNIETFSAISAGTVITMTLTDDSTVTGTYKGINSKGVRFVAEGASKETTRALSRIASVEVAGSADPELTDDSPLVATITPMSVEDRIAAALDFTDTDEDEMDDEDYELQKLDDEIEAEIDGMTDEEDEEATARVNAAAAAHRASLTDEQLEAITITVSSDGVEAVDQDEAAADVTLENADLEAIQQIIDSITEGGDEDGYTSGELAAIFGDSAYNLRKVFRKLGMGVGKGSRYQLGAKDVKKVYDALN